MKKSLVLISALFSVAAFAQPQFDDISKKDVENVSKEFGANFSHSVVAAPETNGSWGIEVGVAGGTTPSPKFKKVVENSGGDGDDFKQIYHAGIIARVHGPFELFGEASFLPEQEFDDVKVKSNSFGLGWNVGGFFNWPLDIAIGASIANGEVSFDQKASGTVPAATIDLDTTTTTYWIGASKTFAFITPYVKAGISKIKGELDATAQIFDISGKTKEDVTLNGGYFAAGANIDIFFVRLGFEAQQMQSVSSLTGKLSFAF